MWQQARVDNLTYYVIIKNKLMSDFNGSVLLLTMSFVITLSKIMKSVEICRESLFSWLGKHELMGFKQLLMGFSLKCSS